MHDLYEGYPFFNINSRRHFNERLSETLVNRPIRRIIVPINHNLEKPKGILKVVAETVICKPKIERLRLEDGIRPEDIKEFTGARQYLERY